jgi:hypothetical protein
MKQIDIQMRSFRLKGDNRTLFCTEAKRDYNLNVLGVYYIPIKDNVLPVVNCFQIRIFDVSETIAPPKSNKGQHIFDVVHFLATTVKGIGIAKIVIGESFAKDRKYHYSLTSVEGEEW